MTVDINLICWDVLTACDRFSHDCRALPSSNGTQCIDSDTCTIDDRCYNGECIGKTLSCHNTNECIQGWEHLLGGWGGWDGMVAMGRFYGKS